MKMNTPQQMQSSAWTLAMENCCQRNRCLLWSLGKTREGVIQTQPVAVSHARRDAGILGAVVEGGYLACGCDAEGTTEVPPTRLS